MEEYYANRWNQEFNTVRTNLEKSYYQKKEALEKEHNQKQLAL